MDVAAIPATTIPTIPATIPTFAIPATTIPATAFALPAVVITSYCLSRHKTKLKAQKKKNAEKKL